MLTELYTKRIRGAQDMSEFEAVVVRVMGCEQCSFMRSHDYLRFRLGALYRPELEEPLECYGERVKVRLDLDRNATVYLLEDCAPAEGLLGKRDAPDSDEEAPSAPAEPGNDSDGEPLCAPGEGLLQRPRLGPGSGDPGPAHEP